MSLFIEAEQQYGSINEFIKHCRLSDAKLLKHIYYLTDMEMLFIHQPHVSDSVIRHYSYKIDWKLVLKYDRLLRSRDLLFAYRHNIDWNWLIQNYNIPFEMLTNSISRISPELILQHVDITDQQIVAYDWVFKWETLAQFGRFQSAALLHTYAYRICFNKFFTNRYPIDINWCVNAGFASIVMHLREFLSNYTISIFNLRKMVDPNFPYLFNCWRTISKYQKLSIQFMADYQKRLDWTLISRYQKINYLYHFRNRVDWDIIVRRQYLPMETVLYLNRISFVKRVFGYKPVISDQIVKTNAILIIQRLCRDHQYRNKLHTIKHCGLPNECCSLIIAFMN